MKKENKNKVGRPKLADKKLKKKAYIILGISALLLVILISGTLVSLNLMPSTKKLKGYAVDCSSIPDYLAYNEETNPNGFKDINFYRSVVWAYGSGGYWGYKSTEYCDTITTEQLSTITDFSGESNNITDANGVQYLTGLTRLNLSYNQLTSLDLSQNTALEQLYLDSNQLTSLDLSHNTALTSLDLENNQLTSLDLSNNLVLESLELQNNNLSSIDLSQNTALTDLSLSENQLTSLDLSHNPALAHLSLNNNQLTSIDLSHNPELWYIDLSNNPLVNINLENIDPGIDVLIDGKLTSKKIIMAGEEISKNIFVPEDWNPQYSVEDESIISIKDDKIIGLKSGRTKYIFSASMSRYNTPIRSVVTITVIEFTSDKYTIDNENKTIDLKGANINSVSEKDFSIAPGKVVIGGNKLSIIIDKEEVMEYTLTNYSDKLVTTAKTESKTEKTTTKVSENKKEQKVISKNNNTTSVKSDCKNDDAKTEKIYVNKTVAKDCYDKNYVLKLKLIMAASIILNIAFLIRIFIKKKISK